MRMRIVPCVALLLLFAGSATAAEREIPIGKVAVKLGALEKDVIPELKKEYALEEIRGGLYQVMDKKKAENVLGIVEVREGKVTYASRDLGAFEGDGVREFGRALYAAMEAAKTGDSTDVKIEMQTENTNTYAVNMVTLVFPDRKIVLYLGRDAGAVDASMEEILSAQ